MTYTEQVAPFSAANRPRFLPFTPENSWLCHLMKFENVKYYRKSDHSTPSKLTASSSDTFINSSRSFLPISSIHQTPFCNSPKLNCMTRWAKYGVVYRQAATNEPPCRCGISANQEWTIILVLCPLKRVSLAGQWGRKTALGGPTKGHVAPQPRNCRRNEFFLLFYELLLHCPKPVSSGLCSPNLCWWAYAPTPSGQWI